MSILRIYCPGGKSPFAEGRLKAHNPHILFKMEELYYRAAGVLAAAVAGGLAGLCCARIAHAYIAVLAAGGEVDAASMRAALLHAMHGSGSLQRLGAGHRHPPVSIPAPEARGAFLETAACAACMSACLAAFNMLHGFTLSFLAMSAAGAMLLVLALIDARTRLLPDALTLPLMWLGLALAWSGRGIALHDAVAGAMAGYGFLWLLFWLFKAFNGREGMGYGDFKLLAALGAWLGWQPLAMVLLMACLAGVLTAMFRQKTLRPGGSYPFGPFLAASGMAAFMLGSELHWHIW